MYSSKLFGSYPRNQCILEGLATSIQVLEQKNNIWLNGVVSMSTSTPLKPEFSKQV